MNTEKKRLNKFLIYLKENEHSLNTILKYERDIRKFLEFLRGKKITKSEVLTFKADLMRKYKVASVNSMLAAVNVFLKFLGKQVCTVKRVKAQCETFCSEKRNLTINDYRNLLKTAEKRGDFQLFMILQTICATGIRVSELKYFTVENLGKKVLEVRNKGKSRIILLPQKLILELKKYCKKFNIKEGFIFQTRNKKPIDRKVIWLKMKKLCGFTKINPEKVFPHNLRHLFAKTFYKINKSLVELSCIFGHSNIETTRRYLMPSISNCLNTLDAMPLTIKLST